MDRTLLLALLPVVLIDLAMKVLAIVSWTRTKNTRGPRMAWIFIILLVNGFGWIAWYLLGKQED